MFTLLEKIKGGHYLSLKKQLSGEYKFNVETEEKKLKDQ